MNEPKYIDITTDFGFKRVFGSDTNKHFLKAFLNELFRGRKEIMDFYYNRNEHVGDAEDIGTVIFDLTCTASNGEKFVIEVQRSPQANLKRRMLYYGSKLIADEAPRGSRREWNYAISEVYVIVLMDGFAMPDHELSGQYLHDICLCDRNSGKVFYEDLGFIYLELVNFTKEESELQTDLEGWLYVLKNMSKMEKLSVYLRKPIFEQLFSIAEYTKLSKEERAMYNVSLKRKWDAESIRQTALLEKVRAREEGLAEGLAEGEHKKAIEAARKMLSKGYDKKDISDLLDISVEEIEKLK